MGNLFRDAAKWLRYDLELEHMLQIQDLRLVRMGFSHDEVMSMTLKERSDYLDIGGNLTRLERYQDAMLEVEVGTLANGFADKKTRKKLYANWDKQIKTTNKKLEFSGGGNASSSSRPNQKASVNSSGIKSVPLTDKIKSFVKKKKS